MTDCFAELSRDSKEIFEARLSQRIDSGNASDFGKQVRLLIEQTYASCGYGYDPKTVVATLPELVSDLRRYFGYLTLEELKIIFKKGYQGEFGEYQGLNNKTYFGWIKAYLNIDARANAIKALEKARLEMMPKPKVLTEQEKEQIIKDGVLKVFNDHKAGVEILDPGNVVFNYLEEKGILDLAPEEAKKLIAESKEKMIQDAILNKGIKPVSKVIEGVISNKGVIVANAKRMALKRYFDSLIEMEIDLSDELNPLT